MPEYQVREIAGNNKVEKITLFNQANETMELEVSGIFIAVGMEPQCDFAKGVVATNENGYVIAGEDCRTNIDGIYAAGDIRTKSLRQVVTAVADGAVAINSLEQDRNK